MADISKYKQVKNTSKTSAKKNESSWLDILNKDIKLFGDQLNDKKKERFYAELNILFSAGVDIKTALELIEEEQQKPQEKALFAKIKEMVINGEGLSEAIQATGKFSLYEYYSIKIGEESGRLPDVLNDLAFFYAGRIKQKRQVTNALSYPIIVLATALGAIFFMMNFVVPMFADVFKRFKNDLPSLTKLVIKISEIISHYSLLIFLVFISSFIFVYSQRKKEWFRDYSSRLLMKVPVVGNIIKKIYLARFCHSMNLLIGAQTPLINALELVRKMVGFYPIEQSLAVVQDEVMKGASLHVSMAKFEIYNSRMLSLLKVAEEVNQLDVIFSKLAKQYGEEVEHQTGLISSLIEPVMIIFLGLLVAVILVAMYLPLFKLSTSFGV